MTSVATTGKSTGAFDVWLSSKHWSGPDLTISFPENDSYFSYQNKDKVTRLTDAQQDTVRQAFADIASFTGLTFTEITETASNEATLRFALQKNLDGAYAYLPAGGERAGDSFYGSDADNPVLGNEAYVYFTHEIGHTMGLNHGHEYRKFVKTGMDSQEFTVVTYTDYVGDKKTFSFDSGPIDWAQSYMQLDIAAMQFLYGANYSATGEVWSGDTVYTFDRHTGEMSINGVGVGTPVGNRIFRTIWDGDGNDTYDLSNYADDLEIDLEPGAFSVFATDQLADLNKKSADIKFDARGNVANALLVDGDKRALIENAVGGSGDDTIKGNAVANTLTGNAGNDRLIGKGGSDNLDGGDGSDVLKGGQGGDWLTGEGQDDRIWGNAGRDTIKGGSGRDKLFGGDGHDRMFGQNGNDILVGNGGNDRMTGGGGADIFRFKAVSDSAISAKGDLIRDFGFGDKIDISALAGPAFTLMSGNQFSGTGPSVITRAVGTDTEVLADVDGDGNADFHITLNGTVELTADDFIL